MLTRNIHWTMKKKRRSETEEREKERKKNTLNVEKATEKKRRQQQQFHAEEFVCIDYSATTTVGVVSKFSWFATHTQRTSRAAKQSKQAKAHHTISMSTSIHTLHYINSQTFGGLEKEIYSKDIKFRERIIQVKCF